MLWKIALQEIDKADDLDVDDHLQNLHGRKSWTNILYWKIIEIEYPTTDSSVTIWEHDLQIKVDPVIWDKLYELTHCYTCSTKLRYFQYRLLNRILTTNHLRHKWDKTVSYKCRLCQEDENETILHIMYDCKLTRKLWQNLERWLQYNYQIPIVITRKMVIFNDYTGKHKNFINFLILAMKQFVYSSLCLNQEPNFANYWAKIHNWYLIEKSAAFLTGKLDNFHRKWQIYID